MVALAFVRVVENANMWLMHACFRLLLVRNLDIGNLGLRSQDLFWLSHLV